MILNVAIMTLFIENRISIRVKSNHEHIRLPETSKFTSKVKGKVWKDDESEKAITGLVSHTRICMPKA